MNGAGHAREDVPRSPRPSRERMTRLRTAVRVRWTVAALCGVAVGVPLAPAFGVAVALLAGWGVLALVIVTWVLLEVWPMGAGATREHATAEDLGRRTARLVATIGSVISLSAVFAVVVQSKSQHGVAGYVLAGVAVVSIVASWALIQVNYMLHYARMYYAPAGFTDQERFVIDSADDDALEVDSTSSEIARGIIFNQQQDPEYTDFAYFSVGLGMTYQVADTNVSSNAIRRSVIGQTLLAYLFGAGILATVINLIAGGA